MMRPSSTNDDLVERLRRRLSPGTKTFNLSDAPPVIASGHGATLVDANGGRYIDMASGSSVTHLGYGNEAVLSALRRQLESGVTHIGPHFTTESQIEMLEALSGLLPAHLAGFHPATNGAEAIEVALKLCRYATGRHRFVSFHGSYHGRTAGALAVSAARGRGEAAGPFLPAVQILPYPGCERCAGRDDADCCSRIEDLVIEALGSPAWGLHELAGVLVEPVQGTGGMLVPPRGFLSRLAARTRDLGVPLVVDEAFTAFGRTGRMFAFEHSGIVPDIVVLAKSLGGGMPAGIVAASGEILERVPKGSVSSTFQLHPAAAAAGAAALRFVIEQDLPARARLVERWFREALQPWENRFPVRAVRGIGAMFGLVIVDPDGRPAAAACRRIRERCLRDGLITYECGHHGEVLGLLPPLVIDRQEFDRGIEILVAALHCAERGQP